MAASTGKALTHSAHVPPINVLALGYEALRHDVVRISATIESLDLAEGWQLANLVAFFKVWSSHIIVDFYRQQELYFFPALAKAVPDSSEAILNLVQQHREVRSFSASISSQLHEMALDIGGGSPAQLQKLKESFRDGVAASVRDHVLFAEENVIPQWKALPAAIRTSTELTLASGKGWKHPEHTLPWLTAQLPDSQFDSVVLPHLGPSWPLPARLVRSWAARLWRPRWHGRVMPLLVSVYGLRKPGSGLEHVRSPHERSPKQVPLLWCCADQAAVAAFPPAPLMPATPATPAHPIPQPAVYDDATNASLAAQASANLPALGAAWRQAADLPWIASAVVEQNKVHAASAAANALSATGKHLTGPRNSFMGGSKLGSKGGSLRSLSSSSARKSDGGQSPRSPEDSGRTGGGSSATEDGTGKASTGEHTTASIEQERTGTSNGLPPPLTATDVSRITDKLVGARPGLLTGPATPGGMGLGGNGSSTSLPPSSSFLGNLTGGGTGMVNGPGGVVAAGSTGGSSSTAGGARGGPRTSLNPRDQQVHGIEARGERPLVLAAPPGVTPEHSSAGAGVAGSNAIGVGVTDADSHVTVTSQITQTTSAAAGGAGGGSTLLVLPSDSSRVGGDDSPGVASARGANSSGGQLLVAGNRGSISAAAAGNPNNEPFKTVPAPSESESPQPGLTGDGLMNLPGAVTVASNAPTALAAADVDMAEGGEPAS